MTTGPATKGPNLCCDDVWQQIDKASFAVLSHVTAAGEPRSSGVVYAAIDRRVYVAVAPTSWKARSIADGQTVSLTVPVRRGGILALLFPIPPATISFHARATIHTAGSLDVRSLGEKFERLLPPDRRDQACVLEFVPEGRFLTYGLGVSLREMRNPAASLARVPVS